MSMIQTLLKVINPFQERVPFSKEQPVLVHIMDDRKRIPVPVSGVVVESGLHETIVRIRWDETFKDVAFDTTTIDPR